MWMKAHQWIVTLGLLALVLAAAVGLILTRQSEQSNSAGSSGRRTPIVDEQPLKTARAVAPMGNSDGASVEWAAMFIVPRTSKAAFRMGSTCRRKTGCALSGGSRP